ncbi:MAG: aminotransferase class I/II-fold pyridoxal phosphate-dependent enzyme [Eggerthellaceae bacterium]|nr:aminotransferase class I/II-fold pyridoxal phosphate-dependent enzyme [Eggerthellaceae bacterium]MDR2721546.1 aminotransferase class I/II-fold pyridoxal phosphate-dependent enzyme [Coriobacteriaceae bacterium]
MPRYADMSKVELEAAKKTVEQEFLEYKAQGLALDMSRGKPSAAQLELSMPMLDVLNSEADFKSADGTDCRNYGVLDGLAEAKALLAGMLEDEPKNTIIFGNASLNMMYDTLARCMAFGTLGSTPWGKLDEVKWLCPVPGYDRHFSVTEAFGITMINIPTNEAGPDMDIVENLVKDDDTIKGIWCVPQYSNPEGITYSAEVVRRLASMECAADDFRIFWDNAYCIHHLFDEVENQDCVLDIGLACRAAENPDRYFKFVSTSKITFPGAGISGLAASSANITEIKKRMAAQTIGHDKLNQLRHARFLVDANGLSAHMKKHAAIIREKFELVCEKLDTGLNENGCGTWKTPRGGYFISFDAPKGTATRIVALAKDAGVVMTGAGATYPYGRDPLDSNIRIAPTLPPLEELEAAMDVFVCCVKLATLEKLLA